MPKDGTVPDCTTSGMLPSFDTLNAVFQGGTGAVALATGDTKAGVGTLASALIYTGAAIYGWHKVHACRRATDVALHNVHHEAETSVAAGDCSHAREIALKLAQDAPKEYVTYVHDPAIAQCF